MIPRPTHEGGAGRQATGGGSAGSPVSGAGPASEAVSVSQAGSSARILDLVAWSGSAASVAPVTAPVLSGSGTLSVTANTSGGRVGAISGTGPSTWAAALPGQIYTASAWVRAATTARLAQAVLAFYDAAGTATGSAWGQLSTDDTGAWTQTVAVLGTAPAGTRYVAVGILFYGMAAGETHYVASPSISARPSGSAGVNGPLHTSGNTIYDAGNQPVTLRGVVADWLDWHTSAAPGSPVDDAGIATTKVWGANVVRVLLDESAWNSVDCTYSSGYAAAVDQVVHSVTSRGMVALLSLHNNGRTPCDTSAQQRMADAPGSFDFWTSVAGRYATNPLVAFDLYNEPHDLTWDQWLNGGTLTDPDGLTWQAAGMQQMYDAVRSTGATNLVVVSGDDWANTPPPAGDLVQGTNIVYAAHAYTCTGAASACTTPNPTAVPAFLTAWSGLAAAEPLMVAEFGWPDPGSGTYNQNVINWAEANHADWTTYAWAPGGSVNPLTPVFGVIVDTSGFEPEASGMPVLAGLAANGPALHHPDTMGPAPRL